MKKIYILAMIMLLMAGNIALTSCRSDDEPFITANEDDEPKILDPYFPDWTNGVPGEFKNITRDINLEATVIVTPANHTTVKWYIDDEEVAEGVSINIPLIAGEYMLKVVATTTKGKETSRTARVIVRACAGDPVPGNDIFDRQVRPGSKAKLHGSDMDKVTKIAFGDTEVPATFVDKGEESYVEYEVPALPLGTYKIKLIDAEGMVYGGGNIVLSDDVPEITENILWEGHHYVSWELPDGDANKTFNLLTKEQITGLSVGTKLIINYTLEPSAEYHQMQLTTAWWTELPGGEKVDLTADGTKELVISQDVIDLVNAQDGFLCVGHGYYVDKITVE